MEMKFFTSVPFTILILPTIYGYEFGPEIDRVILYSQQISTFFTCQLNATILRTALKENISLENVPPRPIMDNDVSYYLITRKNPHTPNILRSSDSLKKLRSSLNVEIPTVFYVHGYNQTIDKGLSNFAKYLLPKINANIIIVNWDSYASADVSVVYTRAITVPRLGKIFGRFVQKLIDAGVDTKQIHLFGFSAGGEVVGLAGKIIRPRVGRISAFDPEGSCFNFLSSTMRISEGDADFVLIVHCSVGVRALPPSVLGDVTFIMNGGVLQPNCEPQTTIPGIEDCSHGQCETYMYESFEGNKTLVGTKCPSFRNYFKNECDCQNRLELTYEVPESAQGVYFVDTTVSNKPCGYLQNGS